MLKRLVVFSIVLVLAAPAANAGFYAYTDENGVTRYRDDSLPQSSAAKPALECVAPISPPPCSGEKTAPAPIPTLEPVCLIPPEELAKLKARKEHLAKEINYVSSCYREARKGMDDKRKDELRQSLLELHFQSASLDRAVRNKNGGNSPPGWED